MLLKVKSLASFVLSALVAIIVRVVPTTTSELMVQSCCGSVVGAEKPVSLASKELSVPALCAATTSVPLVMLPALKPKANQRPEGPVSVKVT